MAIFSQRESVVVVRAAPAADQYGAGATFFEANFWGKLFYAMGILGSGEEGVGIHQYRVGECLVALRSARGGDAAVHGLFGAARSRDQPLFAPWAPVVLSFRG
jgi:hypothetical protein